MTTDKIKISATAGDFPPLPEDAQPENSTGLNIVSWPHNLPEQAAVIVLTPYLP